MTVADQLKQRGVSLYLLGIGNSGDDLSAAIGQSTFFVLLHVRRLAAKGLSPPGTPS